MLRYIYLRFCWLNHAHKTARTSDTIGSRSRITSCYHLLILPERCEVSDWDAAPVSDVAVV